MCSELPIEIKGTEKIVRVVRCPDHVNKKQNKLRAAAFRSQAEKDEVSVIRQSYMGSDFCKSKGKEIMPNNYLGLAVIEAQNIRVTGSTIQDSRSEYYGHAHISHGITLTRNEPPDSADFEAINERCRALVDFATLHIDPNPEEEKWTGAEL